MPANSKKLHTSESTENQVPDFKPDALRSLTEKIESTLKNQGEGAVSKDTPVRPKTKTPNIKKEGGQHVARAPMSTSLVKAVINGSTIIEKQKPIAALKASQEKKRLRDGRVKEKSYGRNGKDVNAIKHGTKNQKNGSGNDTNIDEEVRAFGATKEDVDLIADVVSESEMEDEGEELGKNLGNGLEKEILQLVRQIGVDRIGKKELMADSESDEAAEVDDLEENGDSDMVSSIKITNFVKPASQVATSVGKGQKSLVSKHICVFSVPFNMHVDFGLV